MILCRKRCFPTYEAAARALAGMASDRTESSTYWCPQHQAWHLTSSITLMPKRGRR